VCVCVCVCVYTVYTCKYSMRGSVGACLLARVYARMHA